MRRGAGIWEWCSTDSGRNPDIVLACAGDIATHETNGLAAPHPRSWAGTRRYHGLLIAATKPPVGRVLTLSKLEETLIVGGRRYELGSNRYPGVIHQLIHGRPDTDRFHARGYIEEGTTTTPFDMVVLNHMSRIDLAHTAVQYSPPRLRRPPGHALFARADEMLAKHRAYVTEPLRGSAGDQGWIWTE